MTGSLYNGISGLNVHQKALDVESNNIANVNTVGFKSDTISFADLMYQTGVGTGATNSDIVKHNEQGTLKTTNNPYDFAIAGEGYFIVQDSKDPTEQFYTRAGNFKMGSTGLLQTMDEMNVMGVQSVVTGDKVTNEHSKYIATGIVENSDTLQTINVFATDYTDTVTSTGESGNNLKTTSDNLNDISNLINIYDKTLSLYNSNQIEGDEVNYQQVQITFPTSGYDSSSELSIKIGDTTLKQSFDTDDETTLKKFTDKISSITGIAASIDTASGVLTIDSLVPSENVNITNASANGQLVNIDTIQEGTGSGKLLIDEQYAQLDRLITAAGGEVIQNISTVSKSASNQTPSIENIQLNMDTLGVSENLFGDLTLEDGILYLSDGEAKFAIGELPTVIFSNSLELDPQGSNRYKQTKSSGEPIYIQNESKIINGALELSTSTVSDSLVNLMVYQRSFEASSKSVMTSDQMLQTAIQLKKQ